MPSRRNYIVTYDIHDPVRLRRVFKVCRDYGRHLQLSVFECDLDRREKAEFEAQLKKVINHSSDQIIFIDLGLTALRGDRVITALGQSYEKIDLPCFVV